MWYFPLYLWLHYHCNDRKITKNIHGALMILQNDINANVMYLHFICANILFVLNGKSQNTFMGHLEQDTHTVVIMIIIITITPTLFFSPPSTSSCFPSHFCCSSPNLHLLSFFSFLFFSDLLNGSTNGNPSIPIPLFKDA